MLKRFLLIAALLAAFPASSHAQHAALHAGWVTAGACSQYLALAGRMTAGFNTTAVQNLICGMVTDGTYSLLDGLYVFATNSQSNAQLNWAQNAFNLTANGSITFAANTGVTSDGSTGYFNTGFTPSTAGGHYSANSASMGFCIVNNRTTGVSATNVGAVSTGGATFDYFNALTPTNSWMNWVLHGSGRNTVVSGTRGHWVGSRTSSTAVALYLNGNTTAVDSFSDTATVMSNVPVYILTANNQGSAGGFVTDQTASVFIGAGLTSTQMQNIYNRLHTYFQAVGQTTAC